MSVEAPSESLDSRIRLAVGGSSENAVVFHESAYPAPDPELLMLPGETLLRHLIATTRGGNKPWVYIQIADLAPSIGPLEFIPYTFCDRQITVNPKRLKIYNQAGHVRLSPQSYRLAAFLGRFPGNFFSAADLFQELWDHDADGTHPNNTATVRGHVRILRQKLGKQAIMSGNRMGYAARP